MVRDQKKFGNHCFRATVKLIKSMLLPVLSPRWNFCGMNPKQSCNLAQIVIWNARNQCFYQSVFLFWRVIYEQTGACRYKDIAWLFLIPCEVNRCIWGSLSAKRQHSLLEVLNVKLFRRLFSNHRWACPGRVVHLVDYGC